MCYSTIITVQCSAVIVVQCSLSGSMARVNLLSPKVGGGLALMLRSSIEPDDFGLKTLSGQNSLDLGLGLDKTIFRILGFFS